MKYLQKVCIYFKENLSLKNDYEKSADILKKKINLQNICEMSVKNFNEK